MKFLITFTLAAFSVGAIAQGNLESMKQDATSHLDSKISNLQDAKACINQADSMDKFKSCKYDMHKQMKQQKMEKMQKMEEKEPKQEKEEVKLDESVE